MKKLGDRMSYGAHTFRVLASDMDDFHFVNNWVQSAHPDKEYLSYLWTYDNEAAEITTDPGLLGAPFSVSLWLVTGEPYRGPMDLNVVYTDAAVERFRDVALRTDTQTLDHERFIPVPAVANSATWPQMKTFLPHD